MDENSEGSSSDNSVEAEQNFDQDRFLSLECQERYFENLISKKVLPESGIVMDDVQERLPEFYQRLIDMGWNCFAPQPCRANEQWVREFYANLPAISLKKPKMRIRGKMVHFGAEAMNEFYHLPNHDMTPFKQKDCASGEWLVSKLCPGADVPWAAEKKGITSKEFTAEAKIWLAIICSRISHVSNIWNIPVTRAQMIACILDGIQLNVGELFINELREYRIQNSPSLIFPSLITELCQLAEVEEAPGDNWIDPGKPLHPLKKRGEGSAVKSKKRKLGSSSQVDPSNQPPSSAGGPFAMISDEMRVIRELIAGLPQGPGETSEGPAYISKKEFQKYIEDQRKQGDHLKALEKAYTELAKKHGDLSTSHSNLEQAHTQMVKREKKRDKFFTRMWKGVKGLWKVLKPQDRIPSTRAEDDDEVPVEWPEEEEEEDDSDSDSEESS